MHRRLGTNRPSTELARRPVGRWWAALWLVAACEGGMPPEDAGKVSPPVPRPPAGTLPDPRRAYGMPRDELEAWIRVQAAEAHARAATAAGVEAGRHAAALARVLAQRDGDEERLAEARDWLVEAARRRSLPGACEAALELARLEARDLENPTEAYAVAYRTARRFAGEGGSAQACVQEARRMTAVLAPYRPRLARLAALDADPDADDPSVGLEPGRASGLARWAAAMAGGEAATGSLLEEVTVYGAGSAPSSAPVPPSGAPGAPSETVVRVVLRFDRVAPFDRGEIPPEGDMPRRAYVDFERARRAPGLADAIPVGAAGLERVRLGRVRPGTTRVVFDLTPEARYRLFLLTDPYRVLVDFEAGDGAGSERPTLPAGPTVVLDPGHGGDDLGARYDDLRESVLALDIARRVKREVRRAMPHARVLLTRDSDRFISLEQRTAMANAAGADLFVSIHLNAADEPVEHGGVATFVLDTSEDEQAVRLAARENATTTAEVTGLQRILATLHREEQVRESRRLAERVQRGTLSIARQVLPRLPDRGVKEALFFVLVGARMPSVLVEASFLTHPEEAEMLRTERYRHALAEGIARGIVDYVGRPAGR